MAQTAKNEVLKQETVGYLKSKINLRQAKLELRTGCLILTDNTVLANTGGILGWLIKRKTGTNNVVFCLYLSDIKKISQGKHGIENNVLEITGNNGVMYRMIVKDYQDWENSIRAGN